MFTTFVKRILFYIFIATQNIESDIIFKSS